MVAQRITITIDQDTYDELRAAAPSGEVSAFVVDALRSKLRRSSLRQLLDDLDEIYGPLTDDDMKAGAEWLEAMDRQLCSTRERSSPSPEATAS